MYPTTLYTIAYTFIQKTFSDDMCVVGAFLAGICADHLELGVREVSDLR